MANIDWDVKDFLEKAKKLVERVNQQKNIAIKAVATEILRLSQFEVPHDTGQLQNSGHIEDGQDEEIVGYNKVYAARLHENPQYHFQKGRKGKYLEDPIKNNLTIFTKFIRDAMTFER